MKTIFWIIGIVILVILFGSFPLSLIGNFFKFIGNALMWLAKILNFFHWNGMV